MELGKKISQVRKDNKLTQEDFAEKYNVTRQTISSWENSKSYPDLDTLVKISDDFDISLDVLLKGDRKVIENISKSQKDSKKYKKLLVIVSVIIGLILTSLLIYGIMYYRAKKKLETQFDKVIKEVGFYKNKEGYYSYDYSDTITYSVPNQKMPKSTSFSFHFFARHLFCTIELDSETNLRMTWIDYDYYDADEYNSLTDELISNVGLLGHENIDKISKIKSKVDIDEELLKEAINKGNSLYKQFYE